MTAQLELAPRPDAVPLGGDDRLQRAADEWIHSPLGRQIMRLVYAEIALVLRAAEPGQRVSMDYIIHRLRFRLRKIRQRFFARGIPFAKSGGYALNDHHTAYIARHVAERRPDWADRFERRRVGQRPVMERKTVTITTERRGPPPPRKHFDANGAN